MLIGGSSRIWPSVPPSPSAPVTWMAGIGSLIRLSRNWQGDRRNESSAFRILTCGAGMPPTTGVSSTVRCWKRARKSTSRKLSTGTGRGFPVVGGFIGSVAAANRLPGCAPSQRRTGKRTVRRNRTFGTSSTTCSISFSASEWTDDSSWFRRRLARSWGSNRPAPSVLMPRVFSMNQKLFGNCSTRSSATAARSRNSKPVSCVPTVRPFGCL